MLLPRPTPVDEPQRLAVLRGLGLLDTPPEPAFDELVRLAAELFGMPMALISLVDADRQWFKARVGLAPTETPREGSFCDVAIRTPATMVVEDATADPRFATSPLVTDAPAVRFYAGAPLVTPQGAILGTLCVLDRRPRGFDAGQRRVLEVLSHQVVAHLELRREKLALDATAAALRAQTARLSGIVGLLDELTRHVPGVLYQYRLHPDGRSDFPYASAGMHAMYGVSPESVRQDDSPVFARLHPDDLPEVARAIAASADSLQPWRQEYRVVLPDVGVRWRQGLAQPQRLDDGSVLWHGFISDVTDRRLADEQLLRLNRALRLLGACNLAPPDGRDERDWLAEVCRAAVEAGGYRAGWVAGGESGARRVLVRADRGDRAGGDTAPLPLAPSLSDDGVAARALAGGRTCVARAGEGACTRGGGAAAALPLRIRDQVDAVLVLLADEPDAFQDDEVRTLEDLARGIGLGIDSIRARRQRDAAEVASRAKSAFLANMSHEIRTPLNAVAGLSHLLRTDDPTPRQAERLDKMDRSIRHLAALVGDVLDLSKIEAGEARLDHRPFRLGELIANVRDMVADATEARGLDLTVHVHPDVPDDLAGDPTRLRQVLLNYLGNAVKFTPAGQVRLMVEPDTDPSSGTPADAAAKAGGHAEDEDDGDDTVRLRFVVEDTGIGIEPGLLPRLFRPFVQADESVTRRYGGTGLGLAIVGRLAAMMGGAVGVSSRPGLGSRFWFTARFGLPAPAAAPSRDHPRACAPGASLDRLRERFRGARVLLAEDNEVNREVALALLERAGLAVDAAVDGQEAVERAAAARYDLVLMDLQMPRLSGIDATRRIRTQPVNAWTPIVALTANTFPEDRAACRGAGMDDFLGKPMEPDALYAMLARWLGQPSPR